MAVHLHRIEPARNMRRFYSLDVQPDLFGGFAVVKVWGRIGARGRMIDELHETEALAASAMQRQAERKRRRGYIEMQASHTRRPSHLRSIGGLEFAPEIALAPALNFIGEA
jgi:predicted DNA-binding WGR domain protein